MYTPMHNLEITLWVSCLGLKETLFIRTYIFWTLSNILSVIKRCKNICVYFASDMVYDWIENMLERMFDNQDHRDWFSGGTDSVIDSLGTADGSTSNNWRVALDYNFSYWPGVNGLQNLFQGHVGSGTVQL